MSLADSDAERTVRSGRDLIDAEEAEEEEEVESHAFAAKDVRAGRDATEESNEDEPDVEGHVRAGRDMLDAGERERLSDQD